MSSGAYADAVAPRVATLGRAIPAVNTIGALVASVAETSGQGRRLMDRIIADPRSGIVALARRTDTPAGRAQLVRAGNPARRQHVATLAARYPVTVVRRDNLSKGATAEVAQLGDVDYPHGE